MTKRLDDQIEDLMNRLVEATPAPPDVDLLDRPPTSVQPTVRRPPAWAVALAAAFAIIVLVGLPLLLLGGAQQPVIGDEPVVEPDEMSVGDPAMTWRPVAEPPAAATLRHLWVARDGTLYAYSGSEIWMSADGDRWALAAANVPDLRTISAFAEGFLGTTDPGVLYSSPDGDSWIPVSLPEDLIPSHPALTLHYFVEAVAAGPKGIVVRGLARANVDPAAVEAAFPELGRVTRLDRLAPCGPDGEPMPCELEDDDALWVWIEGSEEPQAVSLASMGLTRADIWQGARVIWFSSDGVIFETVTSRSLGQDGYGGDSPGLVATESGFTMADGEDLWWSPDGREWQQEVAGPTDLTHLEAVGTRVFAFTGADQILELEADGSWTVFADPSGLRTSGIDHGEVAAIGRLGVVAVGYEEMLFPEIAGEEPLTIASVLWFSPDGTTWRVQTVEGSFGTFGTLEVAVLADRVVVGFGAEQPGDLEVITDPEWWIGTVGE